LKHVPPQKGNFIINLREPAHWCGLHIDRKNVAYWFNSFGNKMPIPVDVINFLKRCKCPLYYDSDKPVQLARTGHCGQFVLDFFMHMQKGNKSPIDLYEGFLSHLDDTTDEVVNYLKIRHLNYFN
jgi:hypothetical protein